MNATMPSRWPQVAAQPYAWPFDGRWSSTDSALIVIDVQRDLAERVADAALLDRMQQVVQAARRRALPIVFTTRAIDPSSDADARWAAIDAPDARPAAIGSAGAALARPHWRLAGDLLVQRSAWSPFQGTDLEVQLRARGVRNLILIGLTTDGAVHACMRKANDAGLECLLLEDACVAVRPAHHQTILDVTRFGNGLFGTTATARQLINALPQP
ncbi:MAG TPA: isochorismatase family cysteine hydrolase [Burkholderiaceae bacterium]|nr:isochorismatase family cysteine hydrolase [Burkholderiaceae bacterium]